MEETSHRTARELRAEYDDHTERSLVRSLAPVEAMGEEGLVEMACLFNRHMEMYQHHYLTRATARGSNLQRGGDTSTVKLHTGEASWCALALCV